MNDYNTKRLHSWIRRAIDWPTLEGNLGMFLLGALHEFSDNGIHGFGAHTDPDFQSGVKACREWLQRTAEEATE